MLRAPTPGADATLIKVSMTQVPAGSRAAISGAAGFLGSHFCDRLLAEGMEVIALDNLITGSERNIAHLRENPKFHFRLHDVTRPVEIEGPIDFVLHLASPASPKDYLEHPDRDA